MRRSIVLVTLACTLARPSVAEAQADAGVEDAAVAPSASPSPSESPSPSPSESPTVTEADHDAAHRRTRVTAAVFPPTHVTTPDPDVDPELTEERHAPPPEPAWRLRLGVGASAGTAGSSVLSLRLIQEIEWMPPEVAPILFALTGGQFVGEVIVGLAGARVGLYGTFCEDRLVTCTGAVALRVGAIFGGLGTNVDVGGDGDARFRFDGVELTVRVGFWVIQGATFVDLVGMVGAAF